MRMTLKTSGLTLLAMLLGVLSAAPAFAVAVSAVSTSGLAGQTVNVSINTASLTGLNVDSFQFQLNYSPGVVTATNIITASTLSGAAGWNSTFNVTNNNGTGQVSVSAAGSTPLSGSGTLILISFLINPALLNGSSTGLTFASFSMNEGTPVVTTTNGTLTVNVTPSFGISPASGEIIRGQTLQFNATGTPTLPVTWSTTDGTVATIGSSSGLLTGVAPGACQVTAVDNASHHATTTGQVFVRGMGVTVGTGSVFAGQSMAIPITVTSLAGLAIRSGQLNIGYTPSFLTFASVTTPGGTLLNGYGTTMASASNGVVNIAFAGTTDLTGSGILCYLNFNTTVGVTGSSQLLLNSALFNETLPALRTNGSSTVTGLPTLSVSPFTVTLYDGQTQAFTAGGGATAPLTWSSLNPTAATINPSTGILTAVSGGTTQVKVVDNVGAVGISGVISIYDCKLTLGSVTYPAGTTVQVPLTLDRSIATLKVRSMQFGVSWSSVLITGGSSPIAGISAVWGTPVSNFKSGLLRVAAAGKDTLGPGTLLGFVNLDLSPSATNGTVIPLTLSGFLFNEGHPLPFITNGQITVGTVTAADGPGELEFSLGAAQPNPARTAARISFALPSSAALGPEPRLGLYGIDGRRVRSLDPNGQSPGIHTVTWDLEDDAGRRVPAGVYFVRLEWSGRRLERSIAVVR